jgi:hypothetical protein
MDRQAALSGKSGKAPTLEEQRDQLVARAAAQRLELSRQLERFATLEGAVERLSGAKAALPGMSVGLGLGLSALLLALPAGQTPLVRGGIALFRLASSVRALFKRR